MGLQKKLTKQGNSYSLILDRSLMELINLDPNLPVDISTLDGRSLTITPVPNEQLEKDFVEVTEQMHKRYGKLFKRLAE